MGSRSELGTDGTKVSMCVFLCVREDPLATCLCERGSFPCLFPDLALVRVPSSLKKRGYPRNNKEPALAGPGLRCIILGTVPSYLGWHTPCLADMAGTGSPSRSMPGPRVGVVSRKQMPAFSQSFGHGSLE